MLIKTSELYNTRMIRDIKRELMKNARNKDLCYWVGGYHINVHDVIHKLIPTYVYMTPRNNDYEHWADMLLSLSNKKTNQHIYNIPNRNQASEGLVEVNIYISDSEEEITRLYNDLVFKTYDKLNKHLEKIGAMKDEVSNDFYKTDLVMEKLTK